MDLKSKPETAMNVELAIPRTAQERLAREAESIWGLIKRIEARASDGRFYHLEDKDREKAIAYLKGYAKTHSKVLGDVRVAIDGAGV